MIWGGEGMKYGLPQAQVGNGALEEQKCDYLRALGDAQSFWAATNTSCLSVLYVLLGQSAAI